MTVTAFTFGVHIFLIFELSPLRGGDPFARAPDPSRDGPPVVAGPNTPRSESVKPRPHAFIRVQTTAPHPTPRFVVERNANVVDGKPNALDGNAHVVDGKPNAIDDNAAAIERNADVVDGNADAVERNARVLDGNGKAIEDNRSAIDGKPPGADKGSGRG